MFFYRDVNELEVPDRYEFLRCIGEGRQGKVYECRRVVDNFYVAIKQIEKATIKNVEDFKSRVERQKSMKHFNIVQIIEFVEESSYFYIIYDYSQSHDIIECISKQDVYSENNARLIIRGILEPLMLLHADYKPHLNLKLSNVMIDSYSDYNSIKLSDLGSLDYVYVLYIYIYNENIFVSYYNI